MRRRGPCAVSQTRPDAYPWSATISASYTITFEHIESLKISVEKLRESVVSNGQSSTPSVVPETISSSVMRSISGPGGPMRERLCSKTRVECTLARSSVR